MNSLLEKPDRKLNPHEVDLVGEALLEAHLIKNGLRVARRGTKGVLQ